MVHRILPSFLNHPNTSQQYQLSSQQNVPHFRTSDQHHVRNRKGERPNSLSFLFRGLSELYFSGHPKLRKARTRCACPHDYARRRAVTAALALLPRLFELRETRSKAQCDTNKKAPLLSMYVCGQRLPGTSHWRAPSSTSCPGVGDARANTALYEVRASNTDKTRTRFCWPWRMACYERGS